MDLMSAPRAMRPRSRAGSALLLATTFALAPLLAVRADAQQCGDVPTGTQNYFVLGHEQHVWDMMTAVRVGEGGTPVFSNGVNSIVSAVSSADNQVIYYDHWEDGYEANLLAPAQASTIVLGDNNTANGSACSFTTDPRVVCGGPNQDRLFRGTAIVLNSDQGITGACVPGATNVRCSVPVNPRGVAPTAVVRFDGGDLLLTSGGPLSIIHAQDPLYPYIGGATEMLSQQANANATSFTVPVGENLYRRYAVNGDDTPTEIFKYTYLDIVAYQDNTQVFVNSPVDTAYPAVFPGGSASFTLMKGQHWSSRGAINGGTMAVAAPAVQINAGTRISTTKPLTGLIFTGGDSETTTGYSTDFFPLLPDLLHTTDYTLPMPGTNTAGGASPMNVYIFNPNPTLPIQVTATDSLGSTCFTVPANGFAAYSDAVVGGCGQGGVGRVPPAGSTVRLSANRAFWGVAVADSNHNNSDWGYSWLGNRFLTGNYTCSATPGVLNPVANSTPAQRQALGGFPNSPDPQCTVPPTGAVGACDSANRQPVWIAATLDNTKLRVDLNNDGLFDIVDTNSDDCPDQGQASDAACSVVPPAYVGTCGGLANNVSTGRSNCIYTINATAAPRFLSVYDFTDYDNTGTQIVADKPVAVAYGQDPEQTLPQGAETFLVDTGYVIFPIIQSFLDPVLVLDKTTDRTTVPSATGGQVIYTLKLTTYATGPMTSISINDLLPAGVPGSAYVSNTTLITYPDLTQGTNNPVASVDPATGRARLTWTLSPNTMPANATLTVRYAVNIPAGTATSLTNSATANGTFGSSIFSPSACATIVRTNVTLDKTVVHDGTPEVGDGTPAAGEAENLIYGLTVRNAGGTAETNVRIVDPIPPDTAFAGGIVNTGPFVGAYSAAQNAVVWTAASFAANSGPFTLSFQVAINPGTAVGTVVSNRGGVESTQTSFFQSNQVDVTVVGPRLTATKSASAVGALRPGQTFSYDIVVRNTGTAPADNVTIRDPLPNNAVYVPGTLEWRLNAGAFIPLTDAADADPGTVFPDRLELLVAQLGVTQNLTLRFQARVTGVGGQFVNNQATVASTEVDAFDTNLVQHPIVGNAVVNGRLFLDTNGNGVQDAGEVGIANVDVVVTDSAGIVQRVTTDGNGNYTVTVPAGTTTLNVDELDPDFPPGVTITTGTLPRPPGNDTQTVTAVANAITAAPPVGYVPGLMTLTKRSNGNNSVVPGQVITYTVTLRNNTAATRDNVTVDDPAVPGTSFVAGSTQVERRGPNPAFRVTEYQIGATSCGGAAFTGTTCTVALTQALMPNYFAIVQGSDVNGTTDMTPQVDYARLSNDGFGTGDFTGGVTTSQLVLSRNGNAGGTNWQGNLTVVECLTSCDTAGFRLRSVETVTHTAALAAGTDTSTTAWTDLNQVMLVGGFNGAGCTTASATVFEHPVCHARFFPSGTNTINWTRTANTALTAADSTVMVVEWGSQWNVQHVRVTGTAGGDGVNAANEYSSAVLPQNAPRANTWVWGTGFAAGNTGNATLNAATGNMGTQAEAAVITLGDGTNPATLPAIEGRVAVGTENSGTPVDFEVWALSHPDLQTDWRFRADAAGTSPITQAVNTAGTARMALSYNSTDPALATGTDYPSPMFAARYSAANQVSLTRRRNGANFAAWIQGIDFSNIREVLTTAGNNGPGQIVSAATNIDLAAGEAVTVTFRLLVNDPLAAGITSILNTATGSSQQGGSFVDSASDLVSRPGVVVEYDNAGFARAGNSVIYDHRVTNTGPAADSFKITGFGESGWRIELINPASGAVIATDATGDGVWDSGVTINTGLLNPGEFVEYRVRVTVPVATPVGIKQTVQLKAVSDRHAGTSDTGVDETTVLGVTDVGKVILVPDNSGVVVAGGISIYTHRVVNNTGVTDTFDLSVFTSQAVTCGTTQPPQNPACWFADIHYDSNGDGAYTPGVDIAITNTLQLANQQSQLIFVVVSSPAGATAGTVDVAHLTAVSRANPNDYDGATDTTTVVVTGMDLSGGGTLLVQFGADATHPGTLLNTSATPQHFEFNLTPSSVLGLDQVPIPTELWVDTNGDDVPDTIAATDTNGDGTWDTFGAGFDSNGDGRPDRLLAAGSSLSYNLVRHVNNGRRIYREYVTLTAVSRETGGRDSVTATELLAAVTRATLRGIKVDPRGVVEFATSLQRDTLGFNLYLTQTESADDPKRVLLTPSLVRSPQRDSFVPVLYRVETQPLTSGYLLVEELEADGDHVWSGPYRIGDARLARAFDRVALRMAAAGTDATEPAPEGVRAQVRSVSPRRLGEAMHERGKGRLDTSLASTGIGNYRYPTTPSGGALPLTGDRAWKLEVTRRGRLGVLVQGALPGPNLQDQVSVWSQGQRVPAVVSVTGSADVLRVDFQADTLSTLYSGRNVYVVKGGAGAPPASVALSRGSAPPAPGMFRVEKSGVYVANVAAGSDPWQWDLLFGDGGQWPYAWWDPNAGRFDIPDLRPGYTNEVPVELHLVGRTAHAHTVHAAINGHPVGSLTFEGAGAAVLAGSVPANLLLTTGNALTLTYSSAAAGSGEPDDSGLVYLDALDLQVPLLPGTAAYSVKEYLPALPAFAGVRYLVVTHPLFQAQAARLAQAKEAEGLHAAVVTVDAAYDAQSGGIVEANAIQALVKRAAQESGQLGYVTLVGDDTFDNQDYLGTGAISFVPSLLADDREFGRIPSENLYADVDGDGRPDVAIGRLPVQTAAQAEALVTKIEGQAAALAGAVRANAFAVDKPGAEDAPFRSEAEEMAGVLGSPASSTAWADVAQGIDTARSALQDALATGSAATHYFGHGGIEVWSKDILLDVDELATLPVAPTVLFTWGCESQFFQNLWGPSLNEAFILKPTGGALATFGPAGITPPAAQRKLYEAVYARLAVPGVSLGEAIRQAKAEVMAAYPEAHLAVEGFSLLGDPALQLPAAGGPQAKKPLVLDRVQP